MDRLLPPAAHRDVQVLLSFQGQSLIQLLEPEAQVPEDTGPKGLPALR